LEVWIEGEETRPPYAAALTPEGRHLITANPDGSIYILRPTGRDEVFRVPRD
jgi:hypothetical protein